ncbi:MAG: hypothetical protein RL266_2205 [Bacteroidota bacterium]
MHRNVCLLLAIAASTALLAPPTTCTAQLALYGANLSNVGATDNHGGIFRYVPSTNTYTAPYFGNATDGNEIAGMVRVGDLLYGTTRLEGAHGAGTVFSFDLLTETFTKLADFDSINGKYPVDDMVPAPNGKLYGVTAYGGLNNKGVLFSFDPSTNAIAKLIDFGSGSYQDPRGGLIMGSNGNLYGVVSFLNGAIFEYTIATNTIDYLHTFPPSNGGRAPYGKLTEVQDSVFYGTTRYGGMNNAQEGTIFRYDQRDDSFTTVKFFQGGADGSWPMNGLVHVGNNLYGFTFKGGDFTYGTFFKYDLSQGQFTKLIDIQPPIGSYPENRPILSADGNIYSAVKFGGNLGRGCLVKYSLTTGVMTNIYPFVAGEGTYPFNGLIETCITPKPTGTAAVTLCEGATVADLDANGSQIKWYASASSTTQLSSNTALVNGTYYASQTVQCESAERLAVNVTLQSPPDVGVTLSGQTLTVNETGAQYQWINCATGSNISGATAQSYTATANGEYKVKVTQGVCVATSSCTEVNDVGIHDLDMSTIAVYPNPASTVMTIEGASPLQRVELLDQLGRVVLQQTVQGVRTEIGLATLQPGSYVLRVAAKDGATGVRTVMKE